MCKFVELSKKNLEILVIYIDDDGEKDSSPNFPEKALDKINFSCL